MKAHQLPALLIGLMLLAAPDAVGQGKRVVGYYSAWSNSALPASQIAYENLTHIAHSFAWPDEDGSLFVPEGFLYPELNRIAHEHDVKVVVALGGWGAVQEANFKSVAADPVKRARFVKEVVDFLQAKDYDGVDLDWEYPRAADRAANTALILALRAAFDAVNPAFTLSAAVPTSDWSGGYDVSAIKEALDWIGVMTYDYHGSWTNHAGHNAPLFRNPKDPDGSADENVRGWAAKGMPRSKVLLGVPFYGRRFNATALFGPATDGSALTYQDSMNRILAGWTYTWDDAAKVPYLQDPQKKILVTFEDTTSARVKAEYVQQQGFGGVIIWALHQGKTTDGAQPLLATLGRVLQPRASVGSETDHSVQEDLMGRVYPNPSSGKTTIPFFMSTPDHVRLEAFDLLGHRVALLVDERLGSGAHQALWDASALPGGVYLLALRTGHTSNHTSIVVAR